MTLDVKSTYEGHKGTKEVYAMDIGEMPNGAPYLLPVLVATGAKEGPTLFVNAAMHGDEVLGTESVRRAWKELDVSEMSGRLVATPMANYAGIATRTRRNVIEMYPGPHDMNRVFPGDAGGIMTERIASIIMNQFVDQADYTFDVHCASVGGEWSPYSAVPSGEEGFDAPLVEKARAFGGAFGAPLTLNGMMIKGSLVYAALDAGKVAGMVEFGRANEAPVELRKFGADGLNNLMQHAGILAGSVVHNDQATSIYSMKKIISDRAGFLHHRVKLGERVTQGQVIAAQWDLAGRLVTEFAAPIDGVLCRRNSMATIGTGDIVAYVGATEPQA